MTTHQILILGGTAEARQLAARLGARDDCAVTLSLAGRTVNPVAQPVPVRVGGFGGAQGLADYLASKNIELLIDATHPYAAQISRNAAEAARMSGVEMLALRRPAWVEVEGDRWREVESIEAAVAALGVSSRRVMLTLGRQEVRVFSTAPHHSYLVRSVDPVEPKLAAPDATYLLARGPFAEADERALLEKHHIEIIVAKNSGGSATYGKIKAARALGIEVVMMRRPELPDVASAASVDEAVVMAERLLRA